MSAVRTEISGHVCTVIIDRPEAKNAVDGATANLLADAFRRFDTDPNLRVAVLWGDHGTFCAGADLKAAGTERGNRVGDKGDGPMGPTRMKLSKPVIAAVSGYAVAGGIELACWCDLRVAEEDTTFGVFCRRWGVPLIDGGTVRLPRLIGLSRALDLILTGRAVSAKEAFDIGLVNRLVPKGQARQAAEQLARELSEFPQMCMRGDRLSAIEQEHMDLDAAILNELQHGKRAISSPEMLSGLAKFRGGAGRHGKFE